MYISKLVDDMNRDNSHEEDNPHDSSSGWGTYKQESKVQGKVANPDINVANESDEDDPFQRMPPSTQSNIKESNRSALPTQDSQFLPPILNGGSMQASSTNLMQRSTSFTESQATLGSSQSRNV